MVSQVARMSREERKARTRAELIAAGDRLFREHGFHGTSLDQVAAAAGYTKGAVYSNFASKEDLFFGIYERRIAAAQDRIAEVLGEPPMEVASLLARRTLAAADRGWMAVFFEFWAHVLRNPDLRARFLDLHRRAQAPLVEHARTVLAKDIEDFDAEGWTLAHFAMINGLSLEQLTDPGLEAADLAATMLEAATRGIA